MLARLNIHCVYAMRVGSSMAGANPACGKASATCIAKAAASSRKKSATAAPAASPERAHLQAKFDELAKLQGDAPLIPIQVDGLVVAEVVAAWTGIPLGKMVKDEIRNVMNLEPTLTERVLGQNQAALNSHWYWGTLLAVTLFHGPGNLSLDHWIWKHVVSKRSAVSAQ